MKPTLSTVSPQPALAARPRTVLSSAELFGTQQEIRIQHNGRVYTLWQTRQGRLILTR